MSPPVLAALALEHATVQHGRDVALEHVDLEVGPGERLLVLGPNGGGKTTLVRALLGLLPLSAGRRRTRSGWPRRPAYAPQAPGFDRTFPLTVEAVVSAGSRGSRERTTRWLAEFGLGELGRCYLAELSGGELKRVLLARAFAADPDLLVLDEPTAGLDRQARETLWRRLAELSPTVTVCLVTHDRPPATGSFDRALWVDRTVAPVPSAEVFARG